MTITLLGAGGADGDVVKFSVTSLPAASVGRLFQYGTRCVVGGNKSDDGRVSWVARLVECMNCESGASC